MTLSTHSASSEPLVRYARKLAHDLNNFSTVVRTYSELLLSDLPPDSPTHADVTEIQRAAESMVQYLQRVTRFARAGTMKRSAVDVDGVVREASALFVSTIPSRPVEVCATSGATIQADPVWWRDVLIELLQNAHEASPPGRAVLVTAQRADGDVVVTVEDEGPGFDAAVLPHASEPLVSGKAGIRGAGMGLAIVAAFVGTLGGTLSSAHADGRTVVTLRLPAT